MVFVTARVHPGETPASFVAQGLVDWLLGSHNQAVLLRRGVTIVVVPMLNPDGVFLGNYRCAVSDPMLETRDPLHEKHNQAVLLRRGVTVVAVPMLKPDGDFLSKYRWCFARPHA